jgi:hypothetical protein
MMYGDCGDWGWGMGYKKGWLSGLREVPIHRYRHSQQQQQQQ